MYLPVVKPGRCLSRSGLTDKNFEIGSQEWIALSAVKATSVARELYYLPPIRRYFQRLAGHFDNRLVSKLTKKKVVKQEFKVNLGIALSRVEVPEEVYHQLSERYAITTTEFLEWMDEWDTRSFSAEKLRDAVSLILAEADCGKEDYEHWDDNRLVADYGFSIEEILELVRQEDTL
jgi:hypothetical protein